MGTILDVNTNILYRNNGNATFTNVTRAVGLPGTYGISTWADYDNDGDLDMLLSSFLMSNKNTLYNNRGTGSNYLIIKLRGTVSNSFGIGAMVKVTTGSLTQTRQVGCDSGRGRDSLAAEFGLREFTRADVVEIVWPSGGIQTLFNIAANQVLEIEEPLYLFPRITIPHITTINPSQAAWGELVEIQGYNFGDSQGTSEVRFSGQVAADIGSWSDTLIKVHVPIGIDSGYVTVARNIRTSNRVYFTAISIPTPVIDSLSPAEGGIIELVYVLGKNFGDTQGLSEVRFNGVLGLPFTWDDSIILAIVPQKATSGEVTVITLGGRSNRVYFTVEPPRIDSIDPPQAHIGEKVTIKGGNFGQLMDSFPSPFNLPPGEVRFNGVLATEIISWESSYKIVVTVPKGATSGDVTVTTTNGYISNGFYFNFTLPPVFSCGKSTVQDGDGKTYNTVLIGTQCWMAANLDYDGNPSTNGCKLITWVNSTDVGWCGYYTGGPYANEGLLYQWSAATQASLCPTGWHIPTDTEYKTLEMYLGMTQVQADVTNWRGTNQGTQLKSGGTSGFNALLVGYRSANGSFYNRTMYGNFWSSSQYSSTNIWYRALYSLYATVYRYYTLKAYGFSIRCLKDTTVDTTAPIVTGFTIPATSSSLTVPITSFTATDNIGVAGYLLTETSSTPLISNPSWSSTAPTNYIFSAAGVKTLYAWAKDAAGNISSSLNDSVTVTTVFSCGTSTVQDGDGKTYDTVLIGTQCWMAANLDYDGNPSTNGCKLITWVNSTDVGWCGYYTGGPYANEGLLYQWSAATQASLCPTGWHIPTDTEYKTLEMYLGMTQVQADVTNWRGTNQGTQLKSGGTSGFNALLVGYRSANGSFYNRTMYGNFWSSSQYSSTNIWYRALYSLYATVYRYYTLKAYGFSIRCLKDTTVDTTAPIVTGFTIPATSSSLTVPITSFTATDNIGVAGYLLTETSSTPLISNPSWSSTAPTNYIFSAAGVKTLYAWAKDAAGNISSSLNDSVTIDRIPER